MRSSGAFLFGLLPICILGIATVVYGLIVGSSFREVFDNKATPWFSFAICLWSSVFIEFWKRQEARLAYQWGMLAVWLRLQSPGNARSDCGVVLFRCPTS